MFYEFQWKQSKGSLEDFVEELKRFVKTPVALCTNVFLHKESLVDIRYRKSLRQVFDPVTPTYVYSSFPSDLAYLNNTLTLLNMRITPR